MMMDIEIPANTSATVYVPAGNAGAVQESGKPVSENKEIKVTGTEGRYVVLQTGSGVYHFSTH
jgi:alpha-L-rhamnosidase